jgi:hypothetical protein
MRLAVCISVVMAVFMFACCVVAGRADEQMERMMGSERG